MLHAKDTPQIHAVLSECHEIEKLGDFKSFVRTKVRRVMPHEMAACGLGELQSGRVLRLINVDFPPSYLQKVIRPGEVIASAPLGEWIFQRTPVVVRIDAEERCGSPWYSIAREHGIGSLACHGMVDVSSTIFSYFMFGQLDTRILPGYPSLLNLVVPHLHAALARLLTMEQLRRSIGIENETTFPFRSADARMHEPVRLEITERERQVLRWVAAGKSNWEIGKILCISEFTVKNHVQNVLKKLSVTSRAQAVTKAISYGLISDDLISPDVVNGR